MGEARQEACKGAEDGGGWVGLKEAEGGEGSREWAGTSGGGEDKHYEERARLRP